MSNDRRSRIVAWVAGGVVDVADTGRRGGGRRDGGDERAAGALTGGGPSVLGVVGSMRVRDVSRPTEDDAAAAEQLVQVSYRPRSFPRPPLGQPPASGRRAGSRDASPRPRPESSQPGSAGSGGSSPESS